MDVDMEQNSRSEQAAKASEGHLNRRREGVTIPGEACKMPASGRADYCIATTGITGAPDEHRYDGRPPGLHHRSVFARLPRRSLSAPRSDARSRARGLARAIRHLGDGAASGSP